MASLSYREPIFHRLVVYTVPYVVVNSVLCCGGIAMGTTLSVATLRRQNRRFANTGGVSANCFRQGFVAAFKEASSGETRLSCFGDGSPAGVHILDGLPDDWVTRRDSSNHVTEVRNTVIAGFLHDGRFYTRDQTAELLSKVAN